MRPAREKITLNGSERGGGLVVTNKPEEEGAKIRKLPRFDPSFPFPYFSTVPQTSFWSSSLISLFSDESETAAASRRCEGVGCRSGPTCDRSQRSGGVIFTLTGSRSSRGREREAVSSFWTTLQTPLPPSPLPSAPIFVQITRRATVVSAGSTHRGERCRVGVTMIGQI